MAAERSPLRQGRTLLPANMSVWRFIRDQGGWWSPAELVAALPMPEIEVVNACRILMKRGYVQARKLEVENARRDRRRRPVVLGVTYTCLAPNGETLMPTPTKLLPPQGATA